MTHEQCKNIVSPKTIAHISSSFCFLLRVAYIVFFVILRNLFAVRCVVYGSPGNILFVIRMQNSMCILNTD